MNNWIFTVTNHKIDDIKFSAREIYSQRMEDEFWGLGERTPNRNSLEKGDRIVFYIGNPETVFGGTAIAASQSFKLTATEQEDYSHGLSFYTTDYGVKLTGIEIWETPKFVPDLVPDIEFIENKPYWGTYFQGGIRGISEKDYSLIISSRKQDAISGDKVDIIEGDKQFALEAHLEEFMHMNWNKFSWGKKLKLYNIPESDGRQFPAGSWSIDFLAVDTETNDLVVIELKRAQTSDITVGQVLRYMGWVRSNLATENQGVKGIIVCKEVDDGLRYAISQTKDISVFAYLVHFSLEEIFLEQK